ncbi:MAG TPA: TIGR03435 family protein [Bryobacteraceae bacterium]
MKASTSAIVVALLVGVELFAQAPPAFEVASIRVHSFASADRVGPPIAGNRFTSGGNLKQLIIYAWDLKVYQLFGGPAWVANPSTDTDYYDIKAKAEGDEPLTESRARQLMQTLLADRFQLRLHRESKEMPVYALVVGKAGPKFKDSAPDSTTGMRASVSVTTVTSTFKKSQMSSLVRVLSGAADRPVLDQTGLTGFYDYKIEFAGDPAAAAAESSAASLFTAVQEQLGLKLEPRKAPIEILVIDHAERPSEN